MKNRSVLHFLDDFLDDFFFFLPLPPPSAFFLITEPSLS